MAEKATKSGESVTEKKVTFSLSNNSGSSGPKDSTEESSHVQITAFPHAEIKSILRLDLSSLNSPRTEPSRRKGKKHIKVPEVKVRAPKRTQSYKEPTETVKHALLRSMSHREPSEAACAFFERTLFLRPKGFQPETHQHKMVITPRSTRGPAKVYSSTINPTRVRICCGQCKRSHRILPAAGFCKYCTEYLCAQCVLYHQNRLTRSHPVFVFYCQTCKEMNILNDRGSGHCVSCNTFLCSDCVVKHCSETGHGILEGKDLQDVVDFIIQR